MIAREAVLNNSSKDIVYWSCPFNQVIAISRTLIAQETLHFATSAQSSKILLEQCLATTMCYHQHGVGLELFFPSIALSLSALPKTANNILSRTAC